MPTKKELRHYIRQRFAATPTDMRLTLSERVLLKFERHPLFREARVVMLFYSLPDEVSTHAFIERWAAHKTILLPVVRGADIEARPYSSVSDMAQGAYQIGEPQGEDYENLAAIDLVVVPGMAFDRQGHRLGRGKGYYDRFLSRTELRHAVRVGLCFPFQLVECVPVEAHDVVMHEVIC